MTLKIENKKVKGKKVKSKENLKSKTEVKKENILNDEETANSQILNVEEKNKSTEDTENMKNETKFKCDQKRILQAISVLRQMNDKYCETCEKKPLLDDISGNHVFIQCTLKKIPALKWRKFVKVPLPYPLVDEKSEVCLITGDLDKNNRKAEIDPDILHYKELLKSQNITRISEVMTLRQLRTEYKSYESRRNLFGAYDIFLCDKKIAGVLPKVLGKYFYNSRKIPMQINLNSKDIKNQIDRTLNSTIFCLTCKGNSCAIEVGSLSMKDEEILSNITSSIDFLMNVLPGQVDNIMGLYVKTKKSKALPIYMSFDNPNDIKVKKRKFKKEKVKEEELTTLTNAKVKVYKSGRVVVVKKKSKNKPNHDRLKGHSHSTKNKLEGKIVKKAAEQTGEVSDSDNEGNEQRPRKKFKKKGNDVSDFEEKIVEDQNSDNVAKEDIVDTTDDKLIKSAKRKKSIKIAESSIEENEINISKKESPKLKKFKKDESSISKNESPKLKKFKKDLEEKEDIKSISVSEKEDESCIVSKDESSSETVKIEKSVKLINNKTKINKKENLIQKRSPKPRQSKQNMKTKTYKV